MTFNTTDIIIADIIQTARNNNISQNETLSEVQIESWLFNYRAVLLKQDADKGRPIDPWNIQTIPNIPLIVVDAGEIPENMTTHETGVDLDVPAMGSGINEVRSLTTGKKLLRTKFSLPRMIDLNYGTSLIVYDPVGAEIQLIPKSRAATVRDKR
jgi:hypothetical protein